MPEKRFRLAVTNQTGGTFTTCTATSGNGAGTGTVRRFPVVSTRKAPPKGEIEFFAGEDGLSAVKIVVLQTEVETHPRPVCGVTVSALLWFSLDKPGLP